MDSYLKGNIGEQFVNEIAYKSFFKYWCYPSPKYENGSKKEICDLLVIFKNITIIFSVKNYEFKGNHTRYFKKTIEKAVRQLNGGYRTLFDNDLVEIKHPDKKVERFPKDNITKVFKIIENLGQGVNFYDIARTTEKDDFITIFDKDTFKVITEELDTVPDFIDYLEKRELLFKSKNVKALNPNPKQNLIEDDELYLNKNLNNSISIIGTEKDLLSYFFKNTRSFPDSFVASDADGMILDLSGAWTEYKLSPKSFKKDFADSVSYFLDGFVLNEVLKYDYIEKELVAKELLSLNRLQRRAVVSDFYDFCNKIKDYPENLVHRRFVEFGDLAIVFFNFNSGWEKEIIYRLFELIFETFAYYYKYKHKTFVLIGMTKNPHFAFKIYKNYERFTSEDEKIIEANIKELAWFTDYKQQGRTVNEFPD